MKIRILCLLAALAALVLPIHAQPTVDFVLTNGVVEPHSVAVDSQNKVYLTDSASHRVLKYDADNGLLTTVAGVNNQAGTNNGPGFIARFLAPKGIALARGGLVVADSGNHTLRFLTLTGAVSIVTNLAGAPGVAGLQNGPAATARFNTPVGVAADSAGNIYVADSKNNVIRKIDPANNVTTLATGFFEPSGIAVGDNGDLYVADTRNHAVHLINSSGVVRRIVGNDFRISGTNDSIFAEEALLNSPNSLIWLGGVTGLLVSDTANHTLRRVYFNPIIKQFFPELSGYSVETYAGVPFQPGFVNGIATVAQFNSPVGMARDDDGGLLVADLGNHALRRIQTTPRLPRVPNPSIGWVRFIVDEDTGSQISQLVPFDDAVFYNDPIIAVLHDGENAFYTSGRTPGLFEEDTIPNPNSLNGQSPPPYENGLTPPEVRPSMIDPKPDLTVKLIATAEGRRPSEVVRARVRFQAAAPVILGDNPVSFVLTSDTVGASIWYTLDGSDPTNAAPSIQASSTTVSLRITEPVVFRARAFRANYKPSEISTKTFSPTDFQANRITFGFENGEASSQFLAASGQTFYAPVTLSLLNGQTMYSLQFNLSVTNLNGAASLIPGMYGFESMLKRPVETPQGRIFVTIPPAMFREFGQVVVSNPDGTFSTNTIPIYQDLLITNKAAHLIGVGWVERAGRTNLYDTATQDLITYSQAHDTIFLSEARRVIAGGFSFQVPGDAAIGSQYQIRVARPSATDDGISQDIYIDAPTDGSLTNGAINSIKHVRVVGGEGASRLGYLVGDAAPFRWFNAGDFGDTNLLNNDVLQTFNSAINGFNIPPQDSDMFDAMDSCCDGADGNPVAGNIYDGTPTPPHLIDNVVLGDGELDVRDVFITFRRSIDPSLTNVIRYWSSGSKRWEKIPNLFRGELDSQEDDGRITISQSSQPGGNETNTTPPLVAVFTDDVRFAPGQTLEIPVRARILGPLPLRVTMLNVTVEALDGAPALTVPVVFKPAAELGAPTMSAPRGSGGFNGAWLNHLGAGLRGDATLGTLTVAIPATAAASSAYRVHFEHFSASPNGLLVFPKQVTDGLLTGADRSGSSYGDPIPDHWRLRYFGSLANLLSSGSADADGDGVSNWEEFRAGTNPADIRSLLRLLVSRRSALSPGAGVTLKWPSILNKTYAIEAASSVTSTNWEPAAPNMTGTGGELQFTSSPDAAAMQIYRVRLVE